MTESSVEEELEIVGWTPATVSPVLVAELPGQAVLLGLVSVVASGVHCELPETAIALLERPDEVTAQDPKLSSLRQRGKPTRKSCRVGFIEVLIDMLLLYEERPLSEQGARFTPPTCFPKENLWRQRRTFLVGRSLRRIFPVCGNSSSDIQRPRHLPPMSSPASTQVWCRLCPPWENWPSWLEALEDGRGAPDTAPGELVGAPDIILAERSRWLEGSQGLRAPSLKLPIRHQQATPTQAWRGPWSRKQRGSVSWRSAGCSLATCDPPARLWLRGVGRGCLFCGRVGEDRPVRRWQSAWGWAARAPEAHSRIEPFAGDSGPRARNTAGPGRAAWRAVVLSQACSRQGFAGGVRPPCLADDDRHLVSGARPAAGCHASAGAGFPVASKAAQATACHPNKQWT